jgi:hypothetical protein
MIRMRDRVMLLAFGLVFVALSIFASSSFFEDRRFIYEKFGAWIETDAVIDNYEVTVSEPAVSGRDYIFTIRYEYTVSFTTAAGRVSYFRSTESSERRSSPDNTVDTAGTILPGTVRTLCYDPENPEENRWGGKDEIIKAATSPLRIIVCQGLGVIGLLTIWLAIKPIVREKFQKNSWHGAPLD